MLGQVKPQTVSKDEIEKSGLEICKPAALEQYEKDGRVASNCLERVSLVYTPVLCSVSLTSVPLTSASSAWMTTTPRMIFGYSAASMHSIRFASTNGCRRVRIIALPVGPKYVELSVSQCLMY